MGGLNRWDAVYLVQDGMRYRELIEGVYHVQDGTRHGMSEAADLEAKLYTTYQYTNQSVTDYVDKYLYVVYSVRISGGLPGHTVLAYVVYTKSVGYDDVKALDAPNREISAQRYLTSLLFRVLNKHRFAQLKKNVHNSYVLGQDIMPQYFQGVLQLTAAFCNLPTTSGGRGGGPNDTGVEFSQTVQPGGTNTDNPLGGTKPTNDQKGLGRKKIRK